MSKRFFFLIHLFFLIHSIGIAQTIDSTYEIGKRYTISSTILKENRKYWVRLPKDYNTVDTYPVIYVLDGEMYFPIVSATQGFLDGNKRLSKNKCIVVAIENTDRTRDLTPTPAVSEKGQATMENSGKGDLFFQFIQKELIPHIAQQYATSNRKILIGHSFGGLAASYFFLQHQDCFTDYLIMEPALWWDDHKLLINANTYLNNSNYPKDCHVFLAFAGAKDSINKKSLDQIVQEIHPQNVRLKSQYYPFETHGTVYIHALYDGLRFIFDFELPTTILDKRRSNPAKALQ